MRVLHQTLLARALLDTHPRGAQCRRSRPRLVHLSDDRQRISAALCRVTPEVLVALAILGTGMFILFQNQYASMNLLADAQESTSLRLLLQKAVGEAEREVMLGNEDGDGEFGMRYPDFSYTYTSTAINEDEVPGLLEVTVSVTGPTDEREMKFYMFDGTQLLNEDGTSSPR